MDDSESTTVNSVLAFVKAYRMRNNVTSMKQLALSRFSPNMIVDAKQILWNRCSLSDSGLPFATRRSTERHTQAAADLDDIIAAFNKLLERLDENGDIPQIFCEALDHLQMPPVVVDPIAKKIHENNLTIKSLEENLQQLSSNISGLCSSVSTVESNLSILSSTNKATPSYASAAIANVPTEVNVSSRSFTASFSCNSNLILFGLPMTSSLSKLKEKVNSLLQFLVGTSVPLRDIYRLCQKKSSSRDASSRPRPVILTFDSAFDRRLVLSSVRKLKEFSVKGLFLRADLPLNIRTKRQTTQNKSHSSAIPVPRLVLILTLDLVLLLLTLMVVQPPTLNHDFFASLNYV